MGVAVTFAAAGRMPARQEPLTGRLLGEADRAGLVGLVDVLRRVLGDPTLRVREDDSVDASPTSEVRQARRLAVREGGVTVAVVEHRSAALDEPGTAAAVEAAVRLTLAHDHLVAASSDGSYRAGGCPGPHPGCGRPAAEPCRPVPA